MGENKVQIVIEVDSAKGTAQIKAVGDSFTKLQGQAAGLSGEYGKLSGAAGKAAAEKAKLAGGARDVSGGMDRAATSSASLSSALITLAGAVGAWKIAQQIEETALLAARVETLGVVVDVVGKNANYAGSEMDAYVESVKAMGITTQESQQTVLRFAQAHLDLGKASELARVAQDAAVIGNTNSSESLKGLMHGISTLQPEILRTYGIIVNFEAEYKKFADAAGRTTESLSSQEKQQIALNATLTAGKNIAGSYEAAMATVGKQINSLPRLIEEAKLKVGELFTPAMTVLVQEFSAQLKDLDKYLQEAAANGGMKQWATDIADGVKDGIKALKELVENIRVAIDIVKPFAGTAAEMLVMGLVAEKAFAAARGIAALGATLKVAQTTQLGMNTAMKGFLPFLVFYATYKGTEWLTSWADGTRQVEAETAALTESLKLQQQTLKGAEAAAAEKGRAQRQAEEAYTKQFMEDLRRLAAADDARNAAAQKTREDAMKRQADQDKKALERWDKEKETLGKSGLEKEMALLDAEYAAYQRVVEDKIALEEWFAQEKLVIELKQKSQSIALYEELYKATSNEAYAQEAIAQMQEILDAEEKKWAEILKDDDAAHALRLKREQEYVDKIKGEIKEVVAAEKGAAAERVSIARDVAQQSAAATTSYDGGAYGETAPGSGIGMYTGMPVGRFYINNSSTQINNWYQAARDAQEKTARDAADAAQKIADENKRIADEYQREYEARVNTFESLRGQFTGYLQQRERKNWGMTDYQSEFTRLSAEFGKAEVFETQIDLLTEMLDTLKSLDDIEQDMLDANRQLSEDLKSQSTSIADWLTNLGMGELAPVQSAEAYDTRYNDLLTAAKADTEKIGEFLTYAQEYLQFQKTYGSEGSYATAYGVVTGDVGDLGTTVELLQILSDLGLGTTTDDLGKLVQAFKDMGVPIGDLTKAAGLAKDALGKTGTTDTLNDALSLLEGAASTSAGQTGIALLLTELGKIPASADTATGDTGLNKLFTALGITLPGKSDIAAEKAGLLAGTLQGTEIPFGNIQTAIAEMFGGLNEGFSSLDTFFNEMAANLGLTYTPTNAGTATGYLATKYSSTVIPVQYTFQANGDDAWWVANYNGARLDTVTIPKNAGVNWASEYGIMYANRYKPSGPYMYKLSKGGLTQGTSIAGELGLDKPEWVIPTYEPERSNFLASAPPEFWKNLTPGVPDAMPILKNLGIVSPPRGSSSTPGGGFDVAGPYEPSRARLFDSSPPEFWQNSNSRASSAPAADPDAIGRSIAAQLKPLLAGLASASSGAGGKIELHVHLDGREIASSVENQLRQGHRGLIEQTQRIMRLS